MIEEYHKALKSGTGIESSQLETAQRITALLGILAVVTVRLLNRKLLAATRPDEPVSDQAIGPEALAILAAEYGKPAGGWTNATVLVAIARLGGFRARKRDGQPGWLTIWRGLRQLLWSVHGYDLATREKCGERQALKNWAILALCLRHVSMSTARKRAGRLGSRPLHDHVVHDHPTGAPSG